MIVCLKADADSLLLHLSYFLTFSFRIESFSTLSSLCFLCLDGCDIRVRPLLSQLSDVGAGGPFGTSLATGFRPSNPLKNKARGFIRNREL
jgi:hypothetical protein